MMERVSYLEVYESRHIGEPVVAPRNVARVTDRRCPKGEESHEGRSEEATGGGKEEDERNR